MRYITLILFSLFVATISFCQDDDTPRRDLVVLTNHSQLEGEIIEVSKRWVVIKVGNVPFTIHKTKVASIYHQGEIISFLPLDKTIAKKRVNRMEGVPEYRLVPQKNPEKRGFYNVTYANFGISEVGGVGIENISGYQWNQYSGVGLGVAYQQLGYYNDSRVFPIYTEYRGYFGKRKVCGYYNLAYGINIPLRDAQSAFSSSKPGSYFQPAMGFKFGSDKAAFLLDLALRVTHVNVDYSGTVFRSSNNEIYRSVVLRLGIML